MERITVHGLFVFVGFGLETTISSNMVPTSSRWEQGALKRPHLHGFYRLQIRTLSQDPGRATDSRPPPTVRRYQNWSTFLPQSLPPEQRRKRAAPARPAGTKPAPSEKSARWSKSFAKASD